MIDAFELMKYVHFLLLLSGKTQNRIKSLSELLYNQGFGLFMIKASPPNEKAQVLGVLFEHLLQ